MNCGRVDYYGEMIYEKVKEKKVMNEKRRSYKLIITEVHI